MARGLCPHGVPWDDDVEDGVPRCAVCVSPDALATASVMRARIAALEAQVAALAGALRPFAQFIDQWEQKPLAGMADEFYAIHTGTEWEASLRRSDCLTARAALTADATHLAQLDAARREVCKIAAFLDSTYAGTPTGEDVRTRIRTALDALAKLEGR